MSTKQVNLPHLVKEGLPDYVDSEQEEESLQRNIKTPANPGKEVEGSSSAKVNAPEVAGQYPWLAT